MAEAKIAFWDAGAAFDPSNPAETIDDAFKIVEDIGADVDVLCITKLMHLGPRNLQRMQRLPQYEEWWQDRLVDRFRQLGYTEAAIDDMTSDPNQHNPHYQLLLIRGNAAEIRQNQGNTPNGILIPDTSREMGASRRKMFAPVIGRLGIVAYMGEAPESSEGARATMFGAIQQDLKQETAIHAELHPNFRPVDAKVVIGNMHAMRHGDPNSFVPRVIGNIIGDRTVHPSAHDANRPLAQLWGGIARVSSMARGVALHVLGGMHDADPHHRPTYHVGPFDIWPFGFKTDHVVVDNTLTTHSYTVHPRRVDDHLPVSGHHPISVVVSRP